MVVVLVGVACLAVLSTLVVVDARARVAAALALVDERPAVPRCFCPDCTGLPAVRALDVAQGLADLAAHLQAHAGTGEGTDV